MKTELEVARDAVRTALGDDVADALEWAAAAVKHRATLLSATRWVANARGRPCLDCHNDEVHDRVCPTAATLYALDPEWSRHEVERAHGVALEMARQRSDGPRLTTTDFIDAARYATQALMGAAPLDAANAMLRGAARLRPGELEAVADPDRLTHSAGTHAGALRSRVAGHAAPFDIHDATRVTMADGTQYELRRQPNGDWQWEAVPAERADATAREPIAPR